MRRWRSVAAAVLLLVLAACGMPRSAAPQAIPPSSVPFGLLNSHPATASPNPVGPVGHVYFVHNNQLVAVGRRIPGIDPPAELVRSLLDGPKTAETSAGLSTAIPSRTGLLSLDLEGTVAIVDLTHQFGNVSGSDEVVAVAQIVYTVTTSAFIQAVEFSINGKRVEVPDGSGSLSLRPRTRAEYRTLPQ